MNTLLCNRNSKGKRTRSLSVERRLFEEFEQLQENTVKTCCYRNCSIGSEYINSAKNRYWDILPNNETRVKLSTCDSKSDYINANFIKGEGKDDAIEYIACQAPLDSTTADFWRMIWEQECGVIMMLTGLTEKNINKCACYWPEEGKTIRHGSLLVCNKRTFQVADTFTVRSLLLKPTDASATGEKVREVVQIEYGQWPDYGVPNGTKSIIDLISLMRRMKERAVREYSLNGPVVVHCSAGIGRTGVFLACDITLRKLQRKEPADIQKTVTLMRSQRPKMVMNKEQYALIYSVINDCVAECRKSLENCSQNVEKKQSSMESSKEVEA
eukprot:TRINITY_DN10350_c0_g1_i1.p1 TRINITY_DN10350_c0_g1~~TRINITY_DN10350_c0_g1_i1.p1  ORF type:complete len:327 (+),score=76.33 TRINITY_DN10350_c0_g1_i1:419-1399(+)